MKYKHTNKFYNAKYKKYLSMLDPGITPLSRNNFEAEWERLTAVDPKGKRKPDKDPLSTLVYTSKYSTRYKTALAEKRALASIGIHENLKDLKKMETTDFAARYAPQLAQAYRDAQAAKKAPGETAAILVSRQWFGSL